MNLTDIVVTDADDANVTVTLTLSDVAAGSLSTGTSGAVTSTFAGGVWTASGSVADVNALLAGVTFTPATDYVSDFTITTSVDDGEAAPVIGVKNITAIAINDAPVVTAPGTALSATEQIGLAIHGTGFSVTDVDEAGSGARAVLSVGEGIITVAEGDSGVTIDAGNGTGAVTILGTIAQINNLLTGGGTGTITYLNSSDAPSASTSMTVLVNDSGNTGNDPGLTGDGTSEEDSNSQIINITPVNDAPSVSTNTGLTVLEGSTGTAITAAMLNEGDVDDGGAGLTYTITGATANGTMYLAGFGAIGLTDTFTQADIDAGDISYDHDDSETTSDSFSFSLADGGEDGSTPATGTFVITVTPVNDNDPVITSDGGGASAAVNVLENDLYVSTVVANDVDLPAETLTYSISGGVDAGKFAIDGSTGVLTFVASPDFEAPTDIGGNNVYDVIVQVSDGTRTDTQAIAVTVTDVADSGQYLDLFNTTVLQQ